MLRRIRCVSLVPSARGLTGAISKELSGPTAKVAREAGDQASSSFATSFSKGLGRSQGTFSRFAGAIKRNLLPIGIGLAAVGAAAVGMGLDMVHAAEESIKVSKQTAAVLESTGGVAKVSAKDVGILADALSRKSGIDDELIQSGENVLLTFTRVRNEVGKGNDIFNQATAVALDMSVALGQDMQSSVIQLGKALNDPIKGITALKRVGVTFSEDQVKMIKRLVETGDVLGAQKVILQELTTEFGGSAEAQATASGKLQVAWDNLKEELGTLLLPKVEEFSDWLIDKGIPKVRELAGWIQSDLLPRLGDIWTWIHVNVLPPLGDMWTAFNDALDILTDVGVWVDETMAPAFDRLADALSDTNREAKKGESAWGWLVAGAVAIGAAALVLGAVAAAFAKIATGLGVLRVAIGALLTPFGLFLAGVGFIVLAATGHFDSLIAAWQRVTDNIKGAIGDALTAVMGFMDRLRSTIADGLGRAVTATMGFMERLREIIVGAIAGVLLFLGRNWPTVIGVLAGPIGWAALLIKIHWDTIYRTVSGAVSAVLGFIGRNWPLIVAALAGPLGLAVLAVIRNWDRIKGVFAAGIAAVLGFLGSLPGRILRLFANANQLLFNVGADIIRGLFAGGRSVLKRVGDFARSVKDAIVGSITSIFEIFSPSRVMFRLGARITEGLIKGLLTDRRSLAKIIQSMSGSLLKMFGVAGGGKGVERWRGVALAALALTGQSGAWVNDLLTQMAHESGGNQFAINKWDINAQRGDPSRGLMQTIGATFRRYAGSLVGRGIYDPLANIVAAIRYTLARYGDLGAWRRRGFKGYEGGGVLRSTDLFLGHRGETVFTPDQMRVLGSVIGTAPAGGGTTIGPINIYATTVEGGRAAAKGFEDTLVQRRVLTDARIA